MVELYADLSESVGKQYDNWFLGNYFSKQNLTIIKKQWGENLSKFEGVSKSQGGLL